MTKDEGMKKSKCQTGIVAAYLSFVIRHSCFVIT